MIRSDLKAGVSHLETALAWLGLAASAVLGALWTANAVVAGDQWGVALRFTVSVICGVYYFVLVERCRR